MDPDMVELKIAVARMADQIALLSKTVEKQGAIIEELVALANKGKGFSWILLGMSGIAGALLSKFANLIPQLIK